MADQVPACHMSAPGPNCRLLRLDGYQDILFGCPPETVKVFQRAGEKMPAVFVLPLRTFTQGRNYVDLEFIVYTYLFLRNEKRVFRVICTQDQKTRILTILQETLFGPSMEDLVLSSAHRQRQQIASSSELALARYLSAVKHAARSSALSDALGGLIRERATEDEAAKRLCAEVRRVLTDELGLRGSEADGWVPALTQAYVSAWLMKAEIDHFSLSPTRDVSTFAGRVMEFEVFDSDGRAFLKPEKEGCEPLAIHQAQPCRFEVTSGGRFIAAIDLRQDVRQDHCEPFPSPRVERPEFGVTLLGVGTGFSPDRRTTCLILWAEGQAIAVDLMADFSRYFHEAGFASKDVSHVCLSHVHSDHDGGVLEKILQGEKITLISSRTIFESWLRKAEALTCLRQGNIEEFVRFIELQPGQEVPIPGFARTWVKFDYSFHSIPAGRFVFRHLGPDGKMRSVAWSGDTRYEPALYDRMCEEGRMTARRRDALKGFLWDSDIIIHDAGGKPLHTSIEAIKALPPDVQRKVVMTHVDKTGSQDGLMRYACEGETVALIASPPAKSAPDGSPVREEDLATLRTTGVFSRLSPDEFNSLVGSARVEAYAKGAFLIREGEEGNTFYVLLSGLIEITKDGKVVAEYEPGAFFGELALINVDRRRRASAIAKTDVRVLAIDRQLYQQYRITSVAQENLYELKNFFAEQNSPILLNMLSQGSFEQYRRGEDMMQIGETAQEIFILLSGVVDVLDESGAQVARISKVEVLGEIAPLKNIPRTATVRVVSDSVTAIRIGKDLFKTIIDQFPSFYATTLAKMQKRLESLGLRKGD